MGNNDILLMWLLEAMLIFAAVLQLLLERRKGNPLSLFWVLQAFFFPILLLVALLLFMTGRDYVFQLVTVGLVQEIIFRILRRKNLNKTNPD